MENKSYLIFFFIVSFLLSVLIVKNLNVSFLLNTVLITSSFYLFFLTLRDLFLNKSKNPSQVIAHFGFSLLILSILFNNIFSTEIIINMKAGETFKTKNFKINFEKIEKNEGQNYKSITGKFYIENSKGHIETLNPELRIYNQPNIVTSEADIKTNLLRDSFMTMNLVQNQDYFNIRYQIKPFMIWIWLSVLLISFGGLKSLIQKKNEN